MKFWNVLELDELYNILSSQNFILFHSVVRLLSLVKNSGMEPVSVQVWYHSHLKFQFQFSWQIELLGSYILG